MDQLTGVWIAPEFLNGNTDSGRFIKFLEDNTCVINDGTQQAESTYTLKNDALVLEPTLGLSSTPINYKFSISKVGNNEILTLTMESGLSYTLIKKV